MPALIYKNSMPESHSRLTFPKVKRLRKRYEFLACYHKGCRYFSQLFIIFVLPRNKDYLGFRLGTTVTKKIGKASKRNRVKRLIKEFFRLNQNNIYLDLDYVIVAKRKIYSQSLTYSMVEKDLYPVIQKIQSDLRKGKKISNNYE